MCIRDRVKEQQRALTYQSYQFDVSRELKISDKPANPALAIDIPIAIGTQLTIDPFKFEIWKKTNVYPQKQEGYFAVYVRILNGNISSVSSRTLIEKLRPVIANDIRVTINQGLQFRFVKAEHLEFIYSALEQEGLAAAGFGSVADVTSCPGTDTCNLGISNSTGISKVLSEVIEEEYPEFLYNKDIAIKISGCMNSCGQHGMASIGFHGSSLKAKGQILPALQVLIGGGVLGGGEGRIADKVLKVPSKRGPDVIRVVSVSYTHLRAHETPEHLVC